MFRMNSTRRNVVFGIFSAITFIALAAGSRALVYQSGKHDGNQDRPIREWWGAITAPVFDQPESSPGYQDTGAELFAGPDKFSADADLPCHENYFCGVLPNGRIVKPAGKSAQVGMNPLGAVLTPDGKFLITSNDDERDTDFSSYKSDKNLGGYSLSVVDTENLKVISHLRLGKLFIGLQATGTGPYTVWASGGADNDVKMVTISKTGGIQGVNKIPILPSSPSNKGLVSHYTPDESLDKPDSSGNKPPVPTQFDRKDGRITFPAGSALSPDGKRLYVACNGDNSLAVIDTEKAIGDPKNAVVKQVPVGFFPYAVSVAKDGKEIAVSNWGVMEYKFSNAKYEDANEAKLKTLNPIPGNSPDGFYTPPTDKQKSSSISMIAASDSDVAKMNLVNFISLGNQLDEERTVGDTHPSAMALVHPDQGPAVLYVTKSNSDKLAVIDLSAKKVAHEVELSPFFPAQSADGLPFRGSYPNAIAVANGRIYVAEAGINSVAVLDASDLLQPKLLGRIPTGWYPTSVTVSPDGKFLYVTNAKGVGEDINDKIEPKASAGGDSVPSTRLASDSRVDSNYVFGTVQKIDLANELDSRHLRQGDEAVRSYNFAYHPPQDAGIVPLGGARSAKITHVFFILHENKTFDSMLGAQSDRFGKFASTMFHDQEGRSYRRAQYTGVARNAQLLASAFAGAVNYYSDSEESDAGHQFAASGTASDYTEKTLLVKNGRGLLVNKNFEPEDYPEHGYIFNNAARNGVSFKDYGAMIRIAGTDTGESAPTQMNDPGRGKLGYPEVACRAENNNPDQHCEFAKPLRNLGDASSEVAGLGQSYFLKAPVLATLGGKNANGEDRLDHNYPGYNFNISDQRRAQEFIKDFDRMEAAGTVPQFLYIYQPNDHTGVVQAPNAKDVVTETTRPQQQVADGDVALGMVVECIMKSKVYYNPETGEGSAIFITWDDAQSTRDHIHPHRTPLIVVSPYAIPGYTAWRHYSTASIVKTEELLLGLPPNNLGDLLATDLRDMFTAKYNGITAGKLAFNKIVAAGGSPEGKKIWALASKLDTSAPDRDSFRLGELAQLSMDADDLRKTAQSGHRLGSTSYRAKQAQLYQQAVRLVNSPAPRDDD